MWKVYIRLPAHRTLRPPVRAGISLTTWRPLCLSGNSHHSLLMPTQGHISHQLLSALPVLKRYPPFTHTLVLWLPSGKLPNLPHVHETEPLPARAAFNSEQCPAPVQRASQRLLYWQVREGHVGGHQLKWKVPLKRSYNSSLSTQCGGRNSLSWYSHQTCWITKTQPKGVVSQDGSLDSKAVWSSHSTCSFQWSCLQHSFTKGFTDTTKRWQCLGQGRSWLHCWCQILWNNTLSICCGKNSPSSNTCQRFAKHLLQTVRTQTQQKLQILLEVLLRWCSHQIIWSWKTNHKTKKKIHPALSDFSFLQFEDWEVY